MANEFSLESFKDLYARSMAQKYLPQEDQQLIEKAIAENDLTTLHNVYDLLVANQISNSRIDQDFMAQKNKIVDDFVIEAKNIENRHINAPRRKMAETMVAREQREAENILKNL